MRFTKPIILVAVGVVEFLVGAADAADIPVTESAQTSLALEEIVVTAQKRSENLQDVPIAVSAVTGASLAKTGINNVTDLKLAVPTLNLTNSNGYLTSNLRGVGTNALGAGFENPIALYVDGVYYAAAAASLLSLNNIAQVEVLKGPQGTLFGRNATGGLIQITTRDPSESPGAEVNATYANYQTSSLNAYVGGHLTAILAADLAVEYTHQNEGWGTFLQTGGSDYQVTHDIALRSKWILNPLDSTRITLVGDYSENANTMNALQTIPGTINGFTPAAGPAPNLGYNVGTDFLSYVHTRGYGASLRWDQDISSLKLASISAYRGSQVNYGFDYDATHQALETISVHEPDRQLSQEFQLSSKASGPFTWLAGVYYFHANSGYLPFYLTANDLGALIRIHNQQRTESTAGYVQASYKLAEQTSLTLGGRYTEEKRTAYSGTTDVLVIPLALQLPTTVAANQEAKFSKVTFRASLDHRFNDELFGYVSFNRGFKSGGFNVGTPGSPAYDPETLDAYEIGVKSDVLDKRVRINAAAYYYNYKNIQIQQINLGAITIINGASAHIYGLDLDMQAQATEQLRLTSGIAISHPDFKSFPDCPIGVASGGLPTEPGSCDGNRLPLAAKITASAAADYTIPLAVGSVTANANVYYNSGFYTESDNVFRQPSYVQLGAQVRWTAPGDHFSVGVFGKNLTDRRVINFETTIPNGTHTGFFQAPRTYGVTAGYKF